MTKIEIIQEKNPDTKTFLELQEDDFESSCLALDSDGDPTFLILPANTAGVCNTLIFIGCNSFESPNFPSWKGEMFTIKEIKDLEVKITV